MPADARITDPDDLSSEEQALAVRLAALPAGEFDATVAAYVDAPTRQMRRVLESGDMVQETVGALERLQAATRAALAARGLPEHQRVDLDRRSQAVKMLRAELRPYLNLAAAAAAEKGPRRRAERILGRARYPELKAIMRDLGDGMTEEEALAAHQQRAGGRQ